MDSIAKKIQELDVSKLVPKGWHKKFSPEKRGKIDSGSRSPSKAGHENSTDRLKVQSMAVKDSSSRARSGLPVLHSGPDTCNAGPSHNIRELTGVPPKDMLPSKAENNMPTPVDVDFDLSNQVGPQQHSVDLPNALSSIDPFFIRSVTGTELVCGESRYKCLGCLRYYSPLASLLEHIQLGWKEGFSCKVFYHKLRSMHERRDCMSGQRASALSRYKPQSSDPTLVASPVETRKSFSPRDKKTDMIHKWLQTVEITAVPE